MGRKIDCTFNLFQEGRKYTGHHRKYIMESAHATCYAPETREGLGLREKLGYLGHGRRELSRSLSLPEVTAVKLPDGSSIIMENVPSNVTTSFEVNNKTGVVTHTQEILETAPGKVVDGLDTSRVGGFSWACGGSDGGASGATRISTFHGFDYVMNPGFSANRGYILESATEKTKGMILESIVRAGIADDRTAEAYLDHWRASAVFEAAELNERLVQAAVYESALRGDLDAAQTELDSLRSKVARLDGAEVRRRTLILDSARKSSIVVPAPVLSSLMSMAGPADFDRLVGFFESARNMDLSGLPLPGNVTTRRTVPRPKSPDDAEYGSAARGADFVDPLDFKFNVTHR